MFLAAVAPGEARALYDASVARSHLVDADPPPPRHPKSPATTLLLAKEWGLDTHAERVAASIDAYYEPTWDAAAGEFTWGLGLGERHPRGQYNAFLAAAEANSEGAWTRFAGEGIARGEGEITGIDFPERRLPRGATGATARCTAGWPPSGPRTWGGRRRSGCAAWPSRTSGARRARAGSAVAWRGRTWWSRGR